MAIFKKFRGFGNEEYANDDGGINHKSNIDDGNAHPSGINEGKMWSSETTRVSSLAADTARTTRTDFSEGSRFLSDKDANNAFKFPVFERSVTMRDPGCQNVKWTIDTEALAVTFHVESAKGADWVFLGISENGGMKGADIAVIRMSGSEFVVEDMVSIDDVLPKVDTLQNVELLHSEIRESDQRIIAVIRRKLNTCDADDLPIEANKQYLICDSGSSTSEGDIPFHGSNVANAYVNLMLDEELLLERKFSTENDLAVRTSPTVTVRGDLETALLPFPIDIQMPNINLTANDRSLYICAEVELPFDLSRIREEMVWDDGVILDSGPLPSHFHHSALYKCQDDYLEENSNGVNETYECLGAPPCKTEVVLVRGAISTLPGAASAKSKAGRYILQVRYDNRRGVPITNDCSGIRTWVEPPLIPSQTKPVSVFGLLSHLPSIRIPADLEENDYSIQFMIPGDATREYVPPEGLQVIGAVPHMHEAGLRAQLQLIRDGIHILDVFNTMSYDYDRQVLNFNRWKLLPGDSLLMTCTYKPHPEHDIRGGSTTEDEICTASLGLLAPQESIVTFEDMVAVGYPVPKGDQLKNTFLGAVSDGDPHTLDPSFATFSPSYEEEHFKPIKDHRTNFCELAIRDEFYLPVYSFSEYNITSMLTMIVAFLFCALCGARPVWKLIAKQMSPFSYDNERVKRNTIVYIGQLIYGSIALPITLVALKELYSGADTFNAVEPNAHVLIRGIIVVQTLLFLIELFYRINVRIEIVLHHGLCGVVGMFVFFASSQSFAGEYILGISSLLFLMAVTEHPLNLTLLLKNLGYSGEAWWPQLCKASGIIFVTCKVVPFVLAIIVMVRAQNSNDSSWEIRNHSFSSWLDIDTGISLRAFNIVMLILMSGLMVVQLYVGYVLWVLGVNYERKNRKIEAEQSEKQEENPREEEEELGSNAEEVDRTYNMRVTSSIEDDLLGGSNSSV